MSWFDDVFTGINDLVSGVGGVAENVANSAGNIFDSLGQAAQSIIRSDTVGSNQNTASNNPANSNSLAGYLTGDNIIIAGGVVLFVVAVVNLLKK